jgi:hypothetical protein
VTDTATDALTVRTQRLAALQHANRVRTERARLKKNIAAGHVDALAVLREPPEFAATMKVACLIDAIPLYGPSKIRVVLRRAGISEARTLSGVTERQRHVLIATLQERSQKAARR